MDIFDEDYIPPKDLMDIGDLIEKEYCRKVDKRRKEYAEWKEKLNFLIKQYNTLSGHISYAKIR